jgi:hypothetical protein
VHLKVLDLCMKHGCTLQDRCMEVSLQGYIHGISLSSRAVPKINELPGQEDHLTYHLSHTAQFTHTG